MHNIKLSGYKITTQINKSILVRTKQLHDQNCKWLHCLWFTRLAKNSSYQFPIKNCLFDAANIVKYRQKNKNVYIGYEIALYWAVSWSFGNAFARNVLILYVDNSSSLYADNYKNNF